MNFLYINNQKIDYLFKNLIDKEKKYIKLNNA